MKNHTRIALVSLAIGAAAQAAPFMAIGDGAELFVTGTLGVRVDDNILLGSGIAANPNLPAGPTNRVAEEIDDIIFDINPGLELTFGKDAQIKGALTLSLAFANYTDNAALNTALFNGDFVSRYDDGKMKLGFNVGYHEVSQNQPDASGLAALTRRDIFSAGGNAEVEVSPLTSVAAGIAFTHENYHPRSFTDSDELTVPLDFFYKWTPKMDLSVGYRFREHDVDTLGVDSKDHYFNVGARGEFSPKLTGRVTVGWGQRELEVGGDKSLFGLDASLAWELSEKTSIQFGASNDFGTSPQGQQQENLTVNGMVTTKLAEDWTVNGGLSWRSIDYGSRTDDYFELTLGTTYIVNANIRVVGTYVFRDYSSDIRTAEFKNNVFSIAAQFRY
jgi:polysaccharide biosynthesis protein VpsM